MWMLQWTGEQFLPTIKDASTVYLHVHRYVYASGFLKGKRVLDLAAGEGYGASILAEDAASVVGIVPDEAIAKYAGDKYRRPNLQFLTGLPPTEEPSFDAVLSLDPTEMKLDQASMFVECKRLLKPDGLFVLASQNEDVGELRSALSAQFKHVQILGQRIYANSAIWPVGEDSPGAVSEVLMSRNATDEFQAVGSGQRVPASFIAIATDAKPPMRGTGSIFIDEGNELLEDKEKAIRAVSYTHLRAHE